MTARDRAARKAAAQKKYRQSEKGKAAQSEAYKRYCKSDKGREARKRNR
jgi:hypothetical protein